MYYLNAIHDINTDIYTNIILTHSSPVFIMYSINPAGSRYKKMRIHLLLKKGGFHPRGTMGYFTEGAGMYSL